PEKHFCLSAGKDQGNPVAMVGQPGEPFASLTPIRRIQPDAPTPRLAQSVDIPVVMQPRRVPWPTLTRRARVEIELAKRFYNFWRRKPLVFKHGGALVAAHS